MRFTAAERRAKLATLMKIEGYDSIEDLAQAILSDSVLPAICMNEDCDFTCEMEPDQDAGYCEECRTNSMRRHSSSPDSSNSAYEFTIAPGQNVRGLSFKISSRYKHWRLHGDSHEKWIKEKSLDCSTGSRPEDNGPQENPRRPNCKEVETDRRGNAAESLQHGMVTRLALTTRSLTSSGTVFQHRHPTYAGFLAARNRVEFVRTLRPGTKTM
jgi:hypothetical protein